MNRAGYNDSSPLKASPGERGAAPRDPMPVAFVCDALVLHAGVLAAAVRARATP
jgi:hypothetical protein